MHDRICQRPDRAAGVAPPVVDAGGAAIVVDRIDGVGGRRGAQPHFCESLRNQLALPEVGQGRHGIGIAGRAPHLFRRIAGEPDFALNAVVIGTQVVVFDRPVETAPVARLHLEILTMQAKPTGVVMQGRTPDAESGVEAIVDRICPRSIDPPWTPFEAPGPELRADEIRSLPAGSCLEQDDPFAGLSKLGRDHAAGRSGTDDHDIGGSGLLHHHAVIGRM
jgi:hypothetical protein